METLKFKTTIKCGGCVANVTPVLNTLRGVNKWEVDITDPRKILTVKAEPGLMPADVAEALKTKGYNAELV